MQKLLTLSLLAFVAGTAPAAEAPEDLLEFMSGYCEAILHVSTDQAGNLVADYWKVDDSDDQARAETLEYVKARKLIEIAPEQVVFLRVMSEQERADMLSSAMPIVNPEQRALFDRPVFKYALVKLVPVSQGSLEFLHATANPEPGSPPLLPTTYKLHEFRALVEGYMAAHMDDEEVLPATDVTAEAAAETVEPQPSSDPE